MDTIIIGGGIIGLSAAYDLAGRGLSVLLLDRGDCTGSASTGNAGIIALGHPPLPRPGLIRQTIRMLLDPANPLYIAPRLDPELLRWLWQFMRACSRRQFVHSMRVLAQLGWLAGECFDRLVDQEGLDCEYHKTGWMDVFCTPRRLEQGLDEARLLARYGYRAEVLDRQQLLEAQPAFRENVLGAVHYTDSRFASPGKVLAELADRAMQRGALLRTHTTVREVMIEGGRAAGVVLADGERLPAESVLLAGGIWSTELARRAGVRVPMQAGKGYHMNLTRPEPSPTTTCVLAEKFIAVTPIDNGLRLAGTVELSGINHRLNARRIEMLRQGARQYLHGIDTTHCTSVWCGLRPCTADGLPVIGWAPGVERLFIATGHAMMGFALGPATARLAAECITGEEPSTDLAPLSPHRFIPGNSPRRRRVRSAVHAMAGGVRPR